MHKTEKSLDPRGIPPFRTESDRVRELERIMSDAHQSYVRTVINLKKEEKQNIERYGPEMAARIVDDRLFQQLKPIQTPDKRDRRTPNDQISTTTQSSPPVIRHTHRKEVGIRSSFEREKTAEPPTFHPPPPETKTRTIISQSEENSVHKEPPQRNIASSSQSDHIDSQAKDWAEIRNEAKADAPVQSLPFKNPQTLHSTPPDSSYQPKNQHNTSHLTSNRPSSSSRSPPRATHTTSQHVEQDPSALVKSSSPIKHHESKTGIVYFFPSNHPQIQSLEERPITGHISTQTTTVDESCLNQTISEKFKDLEQPATKHQDPNSSVYRRRRAVVLDDEQRTVSPNRTTLWKTRDGLRPWFPAGKRTQINSEDELKEEYERMERKERVAHYTQNDEYVPNRAAPKQKTQKSSKPKRKTTTKQSLPRREQLMKYDDEPLPIPPSSLYRDNPSQNQDISSQSDAHKNPVEVSRIQPYTTETPVFPNKWNNSDGIRRKAPSRGEAVAREENPPKRGSKSRFQPPVTRKKDQWEIERANPEAEQVVDPPRYAMVNPTQSIWDRIQPSPETQSAYSFGGINTDVQSSRPGSRSQSRSEGGSGLRKSSEMGLIGWNRDENHDLRDYWIGKRVIEREKKHKPMRESIEKGKRVRQQRATKTAPQTEKNPPTTQKPIRDRLKEQMVPYPNAQNFPIRQSVEQSQYQPQRPHSAQGDGPTFISRENRSRTGERVEMQYFYASDDFSPIKKYLEAEEDNNGEGPESRWFADPGRMRREPVESDRGTDRTENDIDRPKRQFEQRQAEAFEPKQFYGTKQQDMDTSEARDPQSSQSNEKGVSTEECECCCHKCCKNCHRAANDQNSALPSFSEQPSDLSPRSDEPPVQATILPQSAPALQPNTKAEETQTSLRSNSDRESVRMRVQSGISESFSTPFRTHVSLHNTTSQQPNSQATENEPYDSLMNVTYPQSPASLVQPRTQNITSSPAPNTQTAYSRHRTSPNGPTPFYPTTGRGNAVNYSRPAHPAMNQSFNSHPERVFDPYQMNDPQDAEYVVAGVDNSNVAKENLEIPKVGINTVSSVVIENIHSLLQQSAENEF
ncbi:hypothetical protein BLNAU_8029 [Blattamonas nauphoetae]|uniref:Uncharacterized protein n=1 Tax=Blattamonas nauphoetae TaxID=2049346 RepID=A0ABQ9XZR3_9EUKA|nr:hypothetical protein BLNAU_8029 [Blattamonas nauphoetae]